MRGKGERGESQVRWKLGNRSRRDEGYRQKLENMEEKKEKKGKQYETVNQIKVERMVIRDGMD